MPSGVSAKPQQICNIGHKSFVNIYFLALMFQKQITELAVHIVLLMPEREPKN